MGYWQYFGSTLVYCEYSQNLQVQYSRNSQLRVYVQRVLLVLGVSTCSYLRHCLYSQYAQYLGRQCGNSAASYMYAQYSEFEIYTILRVYSYSESEVIHTTATYTGSICCVVQYSCAAASCERPQIWHRQHPTNRAEGSRLALGCH